MSNWSSLGGKLLMILGVGGLVLCGRGGGCPNTGVGRVGNLKEPVASLVAPSGVAPSGAGLRREVPPQPAPAVVAEPAVASDPTAARPVEARALKQTPGLYLGRPIEVRQANCYYADAGDYRCKVVGAHRLLVFAERIDPSDTKVALEAACGDVRTARRLPCAFRLRFVLTRFDEDKAYDRPIIHVGPILPVPLATKARDAKSDRQGPVVFCLLCGSRRYE